MDKIGENCAPLLHCKRPKTVTKGTYPLRRTRGELPHNRRNVQCHGLLLIDMQYLYCMRRTLSNLANRLLSY